MAPVYVNLCTDTIREPSYVGEIPQAEQTYTYFHIGYPFMNEHSVLVGEATWNGRRELRNNEAMLNIEQLTAFALQRSTNAREFIQVAGELAGTYGYCDGGEASFIADATMKLAVRIAVLVILTREVANQVLYGSRAFLMITYRNCQQSSHWRDQFGRS